MLVTHIMAAAGWLGITVAQLVVAATAAVTIQDLEPNVTSEITFGLSFEHFDMNTANVHLAKPEVRQAFGLALNRPELVASTVGAFDDRAQVLNNRFYVNNQPEYADTAPAEYNAQDVEGAIALLESVGYPIGADGVATHPQDGPLALKMSTTQNNPLREQTIDLASAQVREAGFAIEKFLDPDIFEGPDSPTSLEARGFEIALFAWLSSPYVSGNVSLYETGGGQNYAGVSATPRSTTCWVSSPSRWTRPRPPIWPTRPTPSCGGAGDDPAVPEADLHGVEQRVRRHRAERHQRRPGVQLRPVPAGRVTR